MERERQKEEEKLRVSVQQDRLRWGTKAPNSSPTTPTRVVCTWRPVQAMRPGQLH